MVGAPGKQIEEYYPKRIFTGRFPGFDEGQSA
jgi:hypothetical protein